ncbi:MAG: hypothetical protein PUE08_01050 [Eubacteriales bacterium]|nr:hypothetical protein [Eubacteriales bacterium]
MKNSIIKNNILIYALLGITADDSQENAVRKIAREAYLTMCRTINYDKSVTDEDKNKAFLSVCEEIIEALKKMQTEYNNAFKEANSELKNSKHTIGDIRKQQAQVLQSSFDKIHKTTCDNIIERFSVCSLTYGQAQKWFNITLKYIASIDFEQFTNDDAVENFLYFHNETISVLHAPVDSYIIEAMWDENATAESSPLPLIKENLLKSGRCGKYSSDKVKP